VQNDHKAYGDCPALTTTESEQTDKKEPHFCTILKRRLLHEGMHPTIPTPQDCPLEEEEHDYML